MFDKLEEVEKRYEELLQKTSDPEIMKDQENWKKMMKEQSDISEIVEKYREYKKYQKTIIEAKEMIEDKELKELAQMELDDATSKIPQIEEELKILLLPKDPNDDKNVIVEIRGGAGGEEASLFAGDLYRMYLRYAETKNWSVQVLNENETGLRWF